MVESDDVEIRGCSLLASPSERQTGHLMQTYGVYIGKKLVDNWNGIIIASRKQGRLKNRSQLIPFLWNETHLKEGSMGSGEHSLAHRTSN